VASSSSALAADEDEAWTPTPPRLSFIDGKVSYWRQDADDWARARPNLALAEGDALYTGKDASFEVQFGSRQFCPCGRKQPVVAGILAGRFA